MRKFTTPMMRQYAQIKKQYKDCILFFRLGDFYELFLEDAETGADVLDITLTSRPRGKDGKVPMAGVPYHAVDNYISKLVKAGYKVAICEQVSEPDKKGIVEREVIRIVTPGTILDESSLSRKENNFLVSILVEPNTFSISSVDISTGLLTTLQTNYDNLTTALLNELSRINPTECILPPDHYNNPEILKIIKQSGNINIYPYFEWEESVGSARDYLKDHFKIKTLESFDIENKTLSIVTCAALISYLKETQKDKIAHITKISSSAHGDYVSMDRSTILNLELFSTIRDHDTRGSFLDVIDQTQTAMGGRMMKKWIKEPLKNKTEITSRHESVEEFSRKSKLRSGIIELLSQINDIERIISRLSVGVGNPRDLISLKESLKHILKIKHKLVDTKSKLNQKIQKNISTNISSIISLIEEHILDEPAVSVKDGGIIKEGVKKDLDDLRQIIKEGKGYMINLEEKERKKTGISTLKVRFNKVFGFYIEVSKANSKLVPEYFNRKQTLVNAERFYTEELKLHEDRVLGAEEEIKKIEHEIYQRVLSNVLSFTKEVQKACVSIAIVDCIVSFAIVSLKNNYVRPKIIYSGEIKIKKGRHPVVEKLLDEMHFVPNDTELTNINKHLLIITGPNMAGKSVYIRQVALIILMAQIGCFVPAQSAHLSIVDRIFVRSGASDVITSGLSTFMVEMVETAYILNHATAKSLIIMDEIGRGTSTYDGISIAWAVAEYLAKLKKPPKTLFATHYHELQRLEDEYPNKIKNFHLAVKEENGEPVFLHTVSVGGASHSFGVAVAKLAGVPSVVLSRAYEILDSLEQRSKSTNKKSIEKPYSDPLRDEILALDLDNITPIKALNMLSDLKQKYGKNS